MAVGLSYIHTHKKRTNNPKLYEEPQMKLDSQRNLEKNKVRCFIYSGFKHYYKALVIKTVWCCHKNNLKNQWNREPINKSTLI